MSEDGVMNKIQVRFCPSGQPTFDVDRLFDRVPCRGEELEHDGTPYVVVSVRWEEDGSAWIAVHEANRPQARRALSWGSDA